MTGPESKNTAKGELLLIDTHCHLEMSRFDKDRDEVIRRAASAGVKELITIGSDVESSKAALDIARGHEGVYATAGVHPHEASSFTDESLEALRALIAGEKKIVAIGETGLDYHYEHSPKEAQIGAFRAQLALALEAGLPVVVHSRKAAADTISILKEFEGVRGVMHCFSGDWMMAEAAMAMGLYISFAGPVTFKNARSLKELAAKIPDDYLLLETDAPYLAPEPVRGRRNEPALLVHTAREIAALRGVSTRDMARITTLNARRLFGIGQMPSPGTIAYRIRDSLYLNVTNRCTNSCSFCVRFQSDYVKGHNLRLEKEPTAGELKEAVGDPSGYREVVFCGYGEPFLRLDTLKEVASWVKRAGGRVRVNTNGHGNLINGRNILPELRGIVDALSVSMDAHDAVSYERLCKPVYEGAFEAMIRFISEARKHIPDVQATVVDTDGVDMEKCRALAQGLGVELRVRKLDVVG